MRILSIVGVTLALLGVYTVFAQEAEPDIDFPVVELGNCANKEECKAYCDEAEHIVQCVDFAESNGLLQGGELDEAKKVAHAIRQGAQLPGGCRGKEECDVYCSEPTHIEECLAFAEAAGFIEPEELEEAKRIAPFMARGEMPGGCRSREQCETYCSDASHTEECVTFFQKAGFMTVEEAEMFRKTGGRGPGGCRGREECDAFCNDPVNQAACFAFAKEHDLIPEEELRNIEEGVGRFREGFQGAPPEVAQCLKENIGEDVLAKIEAGNFLPNPSLGEEMRKCFEEFMPRHGEGFEGELREGQYGPSPETNDCVQRLLGDVRQLQGPPSPELEQRIRQECFPQQQTGPMEGFEAEHPYFEGSMPPDGQMQEGFRGDFNQQYQEEFQSQFDQQYQEEFRRQYEEQMREQQESFTAPDGVMPSPEFHPEEPAPSSRLLRESFLGAVWEAMKPALSRFISVLN